MPVGYPMALLWYKGNRGKIIRRKLVRQQWKRTSRKQQKHEKCQWGTESRSEGRNAPVSVAATLHLLYGQCCAAEERRAGESVRADLGRSEVWSEVGAISRATSISADWGRSSEASLDFAVLQRYLLE